MVTVVLGPASTQVDRLMRGELCARLEPNDDAGAVREEFERRDNLGQRERAARDREMHVRIG